MSNLSLAFVFPGQGSQTVGMLSDFSEKLVVKDTFSQASEVLGYDLWNLCQQGPSESLNDTSKTQPALLASSVALWRLWQDSGLRPGYLAGHSLGEYSALVCAGSIEFEAAISLVRHRGEYMQQAVAEGVGKMAAIIGLDDDKVKEACESAANGQIVSPVNFNSPGQVVIAGNKEAVDRASETCKTLGAKRALPLAVSVPSHCLLMKPASEKLAAELNNLTVKTPEIPVVNNVDVSIESDPIKIKDALVRQLYCPVRWTESIVELKDKDVTQIVECGPGNVLGGLIKRIDRSITSYQTANKEKFASALAELSK